MKSFQHAVAQFVVGLCCIFVPVSANAAPGDLDTTFNSTGFVLTQVDVANNDYGYAISVQPDHKIVVAGACLIQGDYDFCLVRYLPNGTLDPGFGTNGIRTAVVGTGNDFARAMLLLPDGKIVVGGFCDSATVRDFCLMRFTSSGAIDTTFGANGRVFTDVGGGNDELSALALAPDGGIVAVGSCTVASVSQVCMARYLPSGALDIAFSSDGKVSFAFAGGNKYARSLIVQSNGISVIAGESQDAGDVNPKRFYLSVSLTGSILNSNFLPTFDATPVDGLYSVIEQPDGYLIFTGLCEYGAASFGVCVYRTDAQFNPDPRFGNEALGFSMNGVSETHAALQSDGKIVVLSNCRPVARDQLCLSRFHSDGKSDSGFGIDGEILATLGSNVTFKKMHALDIQADGKIVVAGACEASAVGPVRICVARFQGGPNGYQACRMDVDGDGVVRATTDALIMARIALGMTGNAVTNGITFSGATRTNWTAIRNYLVSQCGMTLAP